jgi:hypothetical protein
MFVLADDHFRSQVTSYKDDHSGEGGLFVLLPVLLLYFLIAEALDLIVSLATPKESQGILKENSAGLTYTKDTVIH